MKSIQTCVICGSVGNSKIFNGLDILVCPNCGLFWRKEFILDNNHYEDQDFGIEKDKINLRFSNAEQRIDIIKKYTNLDNLCDVGCGEGVFLTALKKLGYENSVGIEPGNMAQVFAERNDLNIKKGSIEECAPIIKKYNSKIITLFHVIEHLKDPLGALKHLNLALNKGDKLVIETPDTDSYLLKKSKYNHELIYTEHFFYFSSDNIGKILNLAGFRVVAQGRRDFDEKNMSIKDLLYRLGIDISKTKNGKQNGAQGNNLSSVSYATQNKSVVRKIIRGILLFFVRFFKRGNYMWVVAEKI